MDESSNKFRFLIPLLSGLFAVIFFVMWSNLYNYKHKPN